MDRKGNRIGTPSYYRSTRVGVFFGCEKRQVLLPINQIGDFRRKPLPHLTNSQSLLSNRGNATFKIHSAISDQGLIVSP